MDMLTDFNQQIIPIYSPISGRGGSKARRAHGKRNRKLRTRKHKKSKSYSKNTRTRRRRYR
jgi:hypothetical protein